MLLLTANGALFFFDILPEGFGVLRANGSGKRAKVEA